MSNKTIFCSSLLSAQGWQQNQLVTIDSTGMILSLENGDSKQADTHLNGPVIPGMPNLHSHAFQRGIAGLTYRQGKTSDSFWSWRETMYGFVQAMTPELLQAITAGLYLDMLKAGYTSVAEFHYLHHQADGKAYADPAEMSQRVIAAADQSGLSLTLLPVLYQRSGFGQDSVNDLQRPFYHSLDQYLGLLDSCATVIRDNPLHALGIAPHSLRAISEETLGACLDQVRSGPVHIHIAEQPAEVSECEAAYGQRPVAWLMEHFNVDRRWCLVHATHMTDQETQTAAKTGAVAGLCPTTEADLGDGVFKATEWLEQRGDFGVGSDSNLRIDVSEELRLLEFGLRLTRGQRNILADQTQSCGTYLYTRAVQGGAQALSQPIGLIEVGRRADLVELDNRHPLLLGKSNDTILDSYIFAGGPEMIGSVWVAGEQRIAEGQHKQEQQIRSAYAEAIQTLSRSL